MKARAGRQGRRRHGREQQQDRGDGREMGHAARSFSHEAGRDERIGRTDLRGTACTRRAVRMSSQPKGLVSPIERPWRLLALDARFQAVASELSTAGAPGVVREWIMGPPSWVEVPPLRLELLAVPHRLIASTATMGEALLAERRIGRDGFPEAVKTLEVVLKILEYILSACDSVVRSYGDSAAVRM